MAYYIHSLIGILFIFGFGFIAPFEPLTAFGMQVVGIFIGCVYLWSFVALIWPSLLGLVALGFIDGVAMPKVLASSFGSPIVVLIFFAMLLLGAIQHFKVPNYISQWFLTRKMINGKPAVFSFIFLYATYVLAALSANLLPALLFMWSVLYGIFEDVGYKKGESYTNFMVIGTLFAAISGQAAKPFTGSPLLILSAYEKVSGVPIDYLSYMTFGVILSTVSIALYVLIGKYFIKPDMSKIADINIDRFLENKLPPMDKRQRILFASLFGFLLIVLLPSILPASMPGVAYLNKVGPWGVAILFVVVLTLYKYEGKPLLDFREIASKYVVWDIYILIAMAVGITGTLTSPQTGLTPFLTEVFAPMLEGYSAFATTALVLIGAVLITQFANNAVMGAVLMPIIGVFATATGMNYAAVATLTTFAMHIAILTPGASPYAAVLYANVEWLHSSVVFRYGVLILVLTLSTYIVVGIPVMNIIFAS